MLDPRETAKQFAQATHTSFEHLLVEEEMSSFPVGTAGTIPSPSLTPESSLVRFIFWVHKEENDASIVPLVKDCDILAMETVTASSQTFKLGEQADRNSAQNGAILNYFLGAPLTDEEREMTDFLREGDIHQRTRREINFKSKFLPTVYAKRWRIFDQLTNSGVRTEFLDARPSHFPELHALKKKEEASRQRMQNVINSATGIQAIRQTCIEYLSTQAATREFRDNIALQQLESIIDKNPGKSIAVVYGAAHITLSRMITLPDVHLQRVILGSNKIESSEYTVPAALTLEHLISLGTDELSEGLRLEVISNYLAGSYLEDPTPYFTLHREKKREAGEKIAQLWEKSLETHPNRKQLAKKRIAQTKVILLEVINS